MPSRNSAYAACALALTTLFMGIGLGYIAGSNDLSAVRSEAAAASGSSTTLTLHHQPALANVRPAQPPTSMHDLIEREIKQAPVHSEADLEQYLASLEARARARGRVTAVDVEPGITHIERFSHVPDQRVARFGERMTRLREELESEQAARPTPEQARAQLGNLIRAIRTTQDDEERQTQIHTYRELARTLEMPEQDKLFAELNAAIGRQPAPDARALDALWSQIGRAADDAARQPLIRRYLTQVGQLPIEEQDARYEALNAYYARGDE